MGLCLLIELKDFETGDREVRYGEELIVSVDGEFKIPQR